MEILIGDKLWSTWSMRAWLALKRSGEPFTETQIRLRRPQTQAEAVAAGSPTGHVPVLKDGDVTVWDSIAICEYLADRFPDRRLWPADLVARAVARSAAAEMHSGFPSLRGECPMDLSLSTKADLSEMTQIELRRIAALWNDLRTRFGAGGPFLFGAWSIADAFFTPVATRLRSYGIHLSDYGDPGAGGAYAETLLETPEFREWEAAALADKR
ncbi:MAG TPA: glutathione S-transferase family protein [Caulobacteraceae bacterium]|nr:glutathione S-transferase family protein [Caulobacteraceae bacterium]